MKSFYSKEDYNFDDIVSLITNEAEESVYLEFKEAGALDKTDGKRKEISKDVSSFANSDGGVIIYGIKEENHKANEFSFIDGNIYTKEWLEQVINSTIQRHIHDLKIIPIRKDGKIEQTIYIVKIPKSLEAPHISKDKRFYKRFNFESAAMDEYEIRQLYGRKLQSKLKISNFILTEVNPEKKMHSKFLCEVSVYNEGDVSESNYKINVYFNNFNSLIHITWPQIQTNYDYTRLANKRMKISAVGNTPIFPDETVTAIRFNFQIENIHVETALKDVTIETILFYSGGQDKHSESLIETLDDWTKKHKND